MISYLLTFFVLAASSPLVDQPQPAQVAAAAAPQGSALEAMEEFLDAFSRLDEDRFGRLWAEDASQFRAPSRDGSHDGQRLDGRVAILRAFFEGFAETRKARPGPVYLNISPVNLRVQEYGAMAVASFELNSPDATSRRTFVWRRDEAGWRIVHMHASSVAKTSQTSPAP